MAYRSLWRFVIFVCIFTTTWCQRKEPVLLVTGNVGRAFHQKIPLKKGQVHLDLLTEQLLPLKNTSWIKLDFYTNEIYGFPLEGNNGLFKYFVRSTNKGVTTNKAISLKVDEETEKHFHEVQMCTDLTKDTFLKNLDIRYGTIEALARNLLNADEKSIYLRDFQKGCLYFSIVNINNGMECNFQKIDELKRKLRPGKPVSDELQGMLPSTRIKSVNMTITDECVKPILLPGKTDIKWLKTVAPIMVLAAIISLPVGISCYVSRGVRRRQNAMRQQQEKKYKEEAARINEQINEYKKACGFDEDYESDSDANMAPKWKQASAKEEKKMLITKMFEQYVPISIQDRVKDKLKKSRHGKTSEQKPKKYLNPVSRMLDIRKINTNTQSKTSPYYSKTSPYLSKSRKLNPRYKSCMSLNPSMLSRSSSMKGLSSQSSRANRPRPFIPLTDGSKSVSFFDVSGANRFDSYTGPSNSVYRRIDADSKRKFSSCTAVDKLKSYYEGTITVDENIPDVTLTTESTNGAQRNESYISGPQVPVRKRSVIQSVKSLASVGKEIIKTSISEKSMIIRKMSQSNLQNLSNDNDPINMYNQSQLKMPFYMGGEVIKGRQFQESSLPLQELDTVRLEQLRNQNYFGSPRDIYASNSGTNVTNTPSYAILPSQQLLSPSIDPHYQQQYDHGKHYHYQDEEDIPIGYSWSADEEAPINNMVLSPHSPNQQALFTNSSMSSQHQNNPTNYGANRSPRQVRKVSSNDVTFERRFSDGNDYHPRKSSYHPMMYHNQKQQPFSRRNADERRDIYRSFGRSTSYSDSTVEESRFTKPKMTYSPIPESQQVVNYSPWRNPVNDLRRESESSTNSNFYSPQLQVRPHKNNWRSLESCGSSDVTYMDFGSEYEVVFDNESLRRVQPYRHDYLMRAPHRAINMGNEYSQNFRKEPVDIALTYSDDTSYESSIIERLSRQNFV